VMLPAVVAVVLIVPQLVSGRLGYVLAVLGGSLIGALAFGGSQAVLRAPELFWLRSAMRSRAAAVEVGVS